MNIAPQRQKFSTCAVWLTRRVTLFRRECGSAGVGVARRTEGFGGSAGLTLGYHLYTAMRFISPQMRLPSTLPDIRHKNRHNKQNNFKLWGYATRLYFML
jgi:hypothetical protein